MKYVKFLMMMFAAAAVSVGCKTDIEHVQIPSGDNGEYVAPVLAEVGDVVIDKEHRSENVVFNCTPASFGQSVEIRYVVTLTLNDESVNLATAYSPSITVTKADINSRVTNGLGVEPNDAATVGAYVTAYIGSTDVCTAPSNTVYFNVQTYVADLQCYYICGSFVGYYWDLNTAPSIWETDGGTNVFEGMYQFAEDTQYNLGFAPFKVLPQRDWSVSYGYNEFDEKKGFVEQGGNLAFEVTEEMKNNGDRLIYRLSVNMNTMAISAKEAPHPVIIGGWDGKWEDPVDLKYNVEKNVWRSERAVAGDVNFLVRLDDDWGVKFGGPGANGEALDMADVMPDEETEAYQLVEGGGDIPMPAGTWYVKIYADRTPWLIVYEAE